MEHQLNIKTNSGPGVLRLRQTGRRFEVLGLDVSGRTNVAFGFDPKRATEVLDTCSDAWQCFGIANRVSHADVVLSNSEMRAVCVEDIAAALKVIRVRCFDPEEI